MKNTITLYKKDLEYALWDIIRRQQEIMHKCNKESAYNKEECVKRLELMERRENFDFILRILGIDSFQYFNKEDVEIEIL